MKQYKTTKKTIESEQLERCTCDRCGMNVQLAEHWDDINNKYSDVDITNHFISSGGLNGTRNKRFQLCPDCVIQLYDFFKVANKDEIEEIKEDIQFWMED